MSLNISAEVRSMEVTTPLGSNVLLLERFEGTEALSEPFRFSLDLLATPDQEIPFNRVLGGEAVIRVEGEQNASPRHFHGMISQFTRGGRVAGPQGPSTYVRYRAEVVPKCWLLTLQARSRIFQHLTVPEILQAVFEGMELSEKYQGTYKPREYCAQYRESDFAFASRLMEEEGIYYYFMHTESGHTMVLADSSQGHAQIAVREPIPFDELIGGSRDVERITSWEKSQRIQATKVTLWDHHFQVPDDTLEGTKPTISSVQAGSVSHSLKVSGNDTLEVYDYPGGYARRYDEIDSGGGKQSSQLQEVYNDNNRTAGIRMQEQDAKTLAIDGTSNCRQLSAGHGFTLGGLDGCEGDYVLTRVDHLANLAGSYSQNTESEGPYYENRFRCIPAALPFRPDRRTARPRVEGGQTALVVGPEGQEIFTDEYGRVKVQFFWDREGSQDANSSCWVRVGSPWAGRNWGMVHIPRIGQEVIVHFLEGNPDQPIIVGSVYNANNLPPYALPQLATQSGLKTRSTLEGDEETFNELRFEDKKGEEQIYFHAEKDFDRVVENNDTLKVGFDKKDKGDQTIEVFNNQSLTVGAGEGEAADGSQTVTIYKDRTTTLKTGDETLTIEQGKRTTTIKADESLTVQQGKRTTTIQGDDSLTVQQGNIAIKASAGKISVEAAQEISLKVGGNSIVIGPAAITLKVGGNSIELNPSGVTIKGTILSCEAQATATLKGAITQVNGSGMVQVQGGVVMIN